MTLKAIRVQRRGKAGPSAPGTVDLYFDATIRSWRYVDEGGNTYALASGGGGGVTSHPALTGLAWTSSGHTGTASALAGFSGAGAAGEVTVGDGLSVDSGVLSALMLDPTRYYVMSVIPANDTLTTLQGDLFVSGGSDGNSTSYRAIKITNRYYRPSSNRQLQLGWAISGAAIFRAAFITGPSIAASCRIRFGFGSAAFSAVDAESAGTYCMIRYVAGTHTNWNCYTQNAGGNTSTNTSVAVATSTKYTFEIRLTSTSAAFYINGTLVATHTTHLPTTTTALTWEHGCYGGSREMSVLGAFYFVKWS